MKSYDGYLGDMAPETATGRHMIGPFEMLVEYNRNRAKSAEAAGDDQTVADCTAWADVLDTASRCILNEAARADRAEKMVRAHNAHPDDAKT